MVSVSLNSRVHYTASAIPFSFIEQPRFNNIDPQFGPTRGGTKIRITMNEIWNDTGDAIVRFSSASGNVLIGDVRGVLIQDVQNNADDKSVDSNNRSQFFLTCETPVYTENSVLQYDVVDVVNVRRLAREVQG